MNEFLITMGILTYATIGVVLGALNLVEVRRHTNRYDLSVGPEQAAGVLLRVAIVVCFWPLVFILSAIGMLLGGKSR